MLLRLPVVFSQASTDFPGIHHFTSVEIARGGQAIGIWEVLEKISGVLFDCWELFYLDLGKSAIWGAAPKLEKHPATRSPSVGLLP